VRGNEINDEEEEIDEKFCTPFAINPQEMLHIWDSKSDIQNGASARQEGEAET
jgi:hypothetical protein